MAEIETITTKIVYENKWMTVREDGIRRPSGKEGIYGVVDKPDFVVILPVQDGYIHIVEQYRYPVKKRYWELPQGSWESDPTADSALVAAGELREETGLIAKKLTYIGHLYQAYGYSNQGFHVYLATDLENSTQDLDDEEEGLITKRVRIEEFETLLASGEIKDATTIAAYNLAKLKHQLGIAQPESNKP